MNVAALTGAMNSVLRDPRRFSSVYKNASQAMSLCRSDVTQGRRVSLEAYGTSLAKGSRCHELKDGEDVFDRFSATGSLNHTMGYDEDEIISLYHSGCAFGGGQIAARFVTASTTGRRRR